MMTLIRNYKGTARFTNEEVNPGILLSHLVDLEERCFCGYM